jgi:hypothetical protein
MADEKPTIHVDSDWKRQAQEEKQRLAEQEKKKAQEQAQSAATEAAGSAARSSGRPERATMPTASFPTLVQSLVTQTLFYLGDLGARGGQPTVNLDMAKHNIDMLGVLEEKTVNNLAPDEKHLLDAALYETRMRYVSVASQYV